MFRYASVDVRVNQGCSHQSGAIDAAHVFHHISNVIVFLKRAHILLPKRQRIFGMTRPEQQRAEQNSADSPDRRYPA